MTDCQITQYTFLGKKIPEARVIPVTLPAPVTHWLKGKGRRKEQRTEGLDGRAQAKLLLGLQSVFASLRPSGQTRQLWRATLVPWIRESTGQTYSIGVLA